MRKKILKIIESSSRNLNPIEILEMISGKNTTVEQLRDLISELDSMCNEGLILTGSGNTYKKSNLVKGVLDVHEKGNAHLIMPSNMKDIFITRDGMHGACDNDIVLVEITEPENGVGRVVKVINRSLGKSIGEVVTENGKLKVISLDKNLPFDLEIEDNPNIELVDGLLVNLKYVKDINKRRVLARIDSVICHKNAPDADTRLLASEFQIPVDFCEEAIREAKAMPQELDESDIESEINKGREDFRSDIIFTIDGKDTKDIDDAIGLKMLQNGNFELAVHIADVSHYVKEGSALWKEAELRGNSNYLGDKVIPMLPIELSNGICSLNPEVDRYALSCIMEIDRSGNVVNKRVTKGIIKSRKKMNYDAVQDIIDGKDTEDTKDYTTLDYVATKNDTLESIAYKYNLTKEEILKYNPNIEIKQGVSVKIPCRDIIKNMYGLSKLLKIRKEKRGELEFLNDEKKFKFDENGKVIGITPRIQREAEKLIENFMIVANESVARIVFEKKLPFVYRVHGIPSQKSMEDFMKFLELTGNHYTGKLTAEQVSNFQLQDLIKYLKQKENYAVYSKKLLRCMQKAYYSPENIGHYGIASLCYTHFTSPIRRFSDLLVHKSLTEYLVNKNLEDKFLKDWASYLSVVTEHVSETERTSQECEYAMDDMLAAEYMEGYVDEEGVKHGGHIGEEYDATIDSCLPHAFFVQTDNLIEGRVELSTLADYYEYRDELMAYVRNNRVCYRFGDKVRVKCIGASKEKREVDFTLVRKM